MKKLLTSMFAIMLTLNIILNVSANGNIYNNNGITIEFSETTAFTTEQQAVITQMIINDTINTNATPYNLLCTLFGHQTTTETIGIIEHCVSDTAPRCLKTVQDITACTRCETVIDIYTISSYYINCCD